jgi:hypothetical protein
MAIAQNTNKRQQGPVQTPGRVRVTVYLDETLAEWGKHQEGGLSQLIRNLLSAKKDMPSSSSAIVEQVGNYPIALRENYQTLIAKKLQNGLSAEEQYLLEDIRVQINAIDRASPTWQYGERAAQSIDAEIMALRREIEALGSAKNTTTGE